MIFAKKLSYYKKIRILKNQNPDVAFGVITAAVISAEL